MAIIDKPSDYFNTKLYTGTGATQSITGVGFQPDWVWIKKRNGTTSHTVTDSVRGVNKQIFTNEVEAEESYTSVLTAFDSDGFSLSTAGLINASSDTYVAWNWKAGTSFTNDASATGIGTIDSTGSVNQDAGFSICSYTGIGSTGTIKHGLNSAPAMIIVKNRSAAQNWVVYHQSLGNTKAIFLSTTGAASTGSDWFNNTSPTSTVFSVGTYDAIVGNGHNLIAYCFAEKQGFSKFGGFFANGTTDNSFIYTGMKPAFVMFKRTDGTGNWGMWDNKRNTFNVMDKYLLANSNGAEGTSAQLDLLSNGIKIRTSGFSSGNWIYMAFAENPFVSSTGVPACAR